MQIAGDLNDYSKYIDGLQEMLLDFYRRELRRMIGMSKFDYALVFTDMKKFFPAMSGALDVKQIFNIENWQNLLKC